MMQLKWAGHAPGKPGVGGHTAKGQDVSLSWPYLACPLALPTPSIAQRRHAMSAAVHWLGVLPLIIHDE